MAAWHYDSSHTAASCDSHAQYFDSIILYTAPVSVSRPVQPSIPPKEASALFGLDSGTTCTRTMAFDLYSFDPVT